MSVYVQDTDFTLHHGDALDVLRDMSPGSVHCCVTSPPYWGLRDYGTPGQLGLESTPDEYVARMVDVFAEVRRVLRDDGTLWLNLGSSYATGTDADRNPTSTEGADVPASWAGRSQPIRRHPSGYKPKDMVPIPWMVAMALRADGWYLRSDIIWSKPNPMPESVTDRPTKAHEYVFLLSKQPHYYFDQEAVREPATWDRWGDQTNPKYVGQDGMHAARMKPRTREELQARAALGRNVRSVWEIATQPYAEAHFATFPQELPRRCIRAGTSERGCCSECGAPWQRRIEVDGLPRDRGENGASTVRPDVDPGNASHGRDKISGAKLRAWRDAHPPRDHGWEPTCRCIACPKHGPITGGPESCTECERSPGDPVPVPCTVLDPFMGSGTTALVARNLGRSSIGIELNADYCALAAQRLNQQSLLAGDAA